MSEAQGKWPPRLWLPVNTLLPEMEKQFDVFLQYQGDTRYVSLEEAEAMVREAKAEAFEAAAKYFKEAWDRGTPKCDIFVSLVNTANQARAQKEQA